MFGGNVGKENQHVKCRRRCRVNRPLATFRRKNKEDALHLHAQIRRIVTQEKENEWCAFLPAPTPPEGYSEAAQPRRSKHVGTDTLPSSDELFTFY